MHKVIIFSLIFPHPSKKSHDSQQKALQVLSAATVKETANMKNNTKIKEIYFIVVITIQIPMPLPAVSSFSTSKIKPVSTLYRKK